MKNSQTPELLNFNSRRIEKINYVVTWALSELLTTKLLPVPL